MGSAWCKSRADAADDSKSTVGRVIVRCVNQMCPAQTADPAAVPRQTSPASTHEDDKEAGLQLWKQRPVVGPPLPDRPPPHTVSSGDWQSALLTVPEPEPPVPPPRTKRRRWRQQAVPRSLGRSMSFSARPAAPGQADRLRRVGSAVELSAAEAAEADRPRFVFDFTSYGGGGARTPPPSPAREGDDAEVRGRQPEVHKSRDILGELGLPSSLREADKLGRSRASSGRSSMTPSLSELEAALSDLLEAGAAREDDDEDVAVVTPPPSAARAGHFHQPPPLPKEVVA